MRVDRPGRGRRAAPDEGERGPADRLLQRRVRLQLPAPSRSSTTSSTRRASSGRRARTWTWTASCPVRSCSARTTSSRRLQGLAADGFAMPGMYQRRADRFVAHRDRHNSERIFEEGRKARSRNTLLRRLAAGEVPTAGVRYFRRSQYYYPAMRLLLRTLQRFPADDNLILFESGVGRQYADSPRYVYEELVARHSPHAQGLGLQRQDPPPGRPDQGGRAALAVVLLDPRPGALLGQQPELPALRAPPPGRRLRADLARHAAQADAARPGHHRRPGRGLHRPGHDGGRAVEPAGLPQPVGDRPAAQRLPLRRAGRRGRLPAQRRLLPGRPRRHRGQRAAPARASRRTRRSCSTRRPSATTRPRRPAGSTSGCRSTWRRCTRRWATTSCFLVRQHGLVRSRVVDPGGAGARGQGRDALPGDPGAVPGQRRPGHRLLLGRSSTSPACGGRSSSSPTTWSPTGTSCAASTSTTSASCPGRSSRPRRSCTPRCSRCRP